MNCDAMVAQAVSPAYHDGEKTLRIWNLGSSAERKFLPKRASHPQFLETWNSGVKVSDPDYRLLANRMLIFIFPSIGKSEKR